MDWVKGLVGGGRTSGSGQRLGSNGPGGAYPGAAAASPRTPSTGGSVGGRSPGLARQPSAPQVDVVEVTFAAEEKVCVVWIDGWIDDDSSLQSMLLLAHTHHSPTDPNPTNNSNLG